MLSVARVNVALGLPTFAELSCGVASRWTEREFSVKCNESDE